MRGRFLPFRFRHSGSSSLGLLFFQLHKRVRFLFAQGGWVHVTWKYVKFLSLGDRDRAGDLLYSSCIGGGITFFPTGQQCYGGGEGRVGHLCLEVIILYCAGDKKTPKWKKREDVQEKSYISGRSRKDKRTLSLTLVMNPKPQLDSFCGRWSRRSGVLCSTMEAYSAHCSHFSLTMKTLSLLSSCMQNSTCLHRIALTLQNFDTLKEIEFHDLDDLIWFDLIYHYATIKALCVWAKNKHDNADKRYILLAV